MRREEKELMCSYCCCGVCCVLGVSFSFCRSSHICSFGCMLCLVDCLFALHLRMSVTFVDIYRHGEDIINTELSFPFYFPNVYNKSYIIYCLSLYIHFRVQVKNKNSTSRSRNSAFIHTSSPSEPTALQAPQGKKRTLSRQNKTA